MRISRLLSATVALVLCSPVFAQQAIKELSGALTLNSGLDLTYAGPVLYRATLHTRTGLDCQLTGTFTVRKGAEHKPRWLEALPNSSFIHCPGQAPALVSGHIFPVVWMPPQTVWCRDKTSKGKCQAYSAAAGAGITALWVTWHAMTSKGSAKRK